MEDEAGQGEVAGAGTCNVVMPWFLGGPWVPKFGDEERQAGFADWRIQIETFLSAQHLHQAQQVDFVLSALQGEARREILLLLPAERDTPAKIFQALGGLYGEKATIV